MPIRNAYWLCSRVSLHGLLALWLVLTCAYSAAEVSTAYLSVCTCLLQVPQQIFITDVLPKGPTGKIQRRFMADAFIKAKPNSSSGSGNSKAAGVSRNPAAALELSPSPCTSPSQGSSNSSSQGCDHGISRVPASSTAGPPGGGAEGHAIVAQALAHAGVRFMFGVVGIPVTSLASSAQAAGIRYIGMRNEQAAGKSGHYILTCCSPG